MKLRERILAVAVASLWLIVSCTNPAVSVFALFYLGCCCNVPSLCVCKNQAKWKAGGRWSALHGWCERGDLNPHGFTRQILSLVRLPIPPLSHSFFSSTSLGDAWMRFAGRRFIRHRPGRNTRRNQAIDGGMNVFRRQVSVPHTHLNCSVTHELCDSPNVDAGRVALRCSLAGLPGWLSPTSTMRHLQRDQFEGNYSSGVGRLRPAWQLVILRRIPPGASRPVRVCQDQE